MPDSTLGLLFNSGRTEKQRIRVEIPRRKPVPPQLMYPNRMPLIGSPIGYLSNCHNTKERGEAPGLQDVLLVMDTLSVRRECRN